ncbi:MAG: DUF4363 family protein [Oscillospiraceae bacterium]|nr:DUF4363 family protein [Oscillospiraceae bacterium]
MRGIICIVVLGLTALFCVVVHVNLQGGIEALERDMAQVAVALQDDDWAQAETLMQSITKRWRRKQGFYALFARHQLYEPVAIGMKTLPRLISEQEKEAYRTALTLREELYLLREAERFAARNIL